MCIGLPMTVRECNEHTALCERRGEARHVSVLLLGAVPAGTQVLVHVDTAVRVLDAEEARQIDDALDGVAAAAAGLPFEHLFADLIGREPELPAFLRTDKQENKQGQGSALDPPRAERPLDPIR